MSRRAPRSRNVPWIPRALTSGVAVLALVVALIPVGTAAASASVPAISAETLTLPEEDVESPTPTPTPTPGDDEAQDGAVTPDGDAVPDAPAIPETDGTDSDGTDSDGAQDDIEVQDDTAPHDEVDAAEDAQAEEVDALSDAESFTLAGFRPGNIISDAVFTDATTMTESQIQAFFDSKVKTCRGGSDKYGPIVCLKDFTITSVDRPADKYCDGYKGAPNESAARIIYRAAISCDINPEVLIVMLQKEQSLVTHTWPSAWRYDKALGQGCPDGGVPCNPAYVGFFHQIYGAARQMQMYMEGRHFTWYAPGNTWNILYHPNRACGTAPVHVENKATSALYYYTPYQPNRAALQAGYGSGDSCSSYGNRNFYNYFTDWFGSTQTPAPPPPAPAEPLPTVQSADTSDYVIGLDRQGTLWAYPFEDGQWGTRVVMREGVDATTVFGVGDLTGNGHRDFVAVGRDGVARLLPGDGTLSLGTPRVLTDAWKNAVLITPAGDFDGDGIGDVFTTDSKGRLFLWRGKDTGAYRPGKQVGTGWQVMDTIIGGTDMTGDGHVDLVARRKDGNLVVYRGTGTGTWNGTVQAGHGWQAKAKIFLPGDFTGDGRADILASDAGGSLMSYIGLGNGRVSTGEVVGTAWHSLTSAQGAGMPGGKPRPSAPGAGDVDGDGNSDVLALSTRGEFKLYRGNGTGGWRGSQTLDVTWKGSDRLLPMGDFDGDGIRDVGRISSDGRFYLLPGNGDGGFGKARQIGSGWGAMGLVIPGVDYNGDGTPDVLARNTVGELILYAGNGRGGWLPERPKIGHGWQVIDSAFHVGDFDGDGRQDVLARRTDGGLWLYPVTGSGAWGGAERVGTGWQVMTALAGPGDFNGDGTVDVLARDKAGDLHLYGGDGKGGWLRPVRIGWRWDTIAQIR